MPDGEVRTFSVINRVEDRRDGGVAIENGASNVGEIVPVRAVREEGDVGRLVFGIPGTAWRGHRHHEAFSGEASTLRVERRAARRLR